ncbi:hypothetical protein Micbo1qcDRAFT_209644 [Microdochium bolleyi]|uniref:Uncharacterized protein n=1 Tax=Microdochium bolleyi TaxID=196109 RepID=A0A136ILK9_9PEZI|nr:hypothetical protein Micbo1qcDRAFT_209644 [Microdochium bolleyi]
MRILEVSAGTGGATAPALEALDSGKDAVDGERATLFRRYCYTGIPAGFSGKARDKFRQWEHVVDFRAVNVTKYLADQWEDGDSGADHGNNKFDLIIPVNVLYMRHHCSMSPSAIVASF